MVSEVVEYGEDRVVFDTFSRYSDTGPGIKVIIEKSRGEVSLMEENTIENVSLTIKILK